MKIAILFEGSPKKPGGYYQSLQSASILSEIKDERFELEFITLENETFNLLREKNFKVKLFENTFYKRLFNFLSIFQFFKNLASNYSIKNPFSKFLEKNNYDLIFFLSPSALSLHCGKVNFVINIWDLDHKKNSPYPEHRADYNYSKREQLLNYSLFHSFRVIVPENITSQELIEIYHCDKEKIVVQSFIPYLPKLYEDKKKNTDFEKIFKEFNINKKKLIFYPANFWPHKNHNYLIDVSKILKQEKNNDYLFVFCGGDSGNLNFIKKEIEKYNLYEYFKILPQVSDDQLISLYLNSYAVVMPTTGGPSNLSLYESFYFKKVIFYSQHLLKNTELSRNIIKIDINNPADLFKKLLKLNSSDIENITSEAFNYYLSNCNFEKLKKNYLSIMENYHKTRSKWN